MLDLIILLSTCLFCGVFAGLTSGLLGLGGGLVIVPVLNYVLPLLYPVFDNKLSDLLLPICICTSFAVIIFNTITSAYKQHKRNSISWRAVLLVAPALVISSQAIGYIIPKANPGYLKIFFALVLLVSAIKMLRSKKISEEERTVAPPIPVKKGLLAGMTIGAISATAGISGGSFLGPFFSQSAKFPIKIALGTSSACGVFLAISGFIAYFVNGLQNIDRTSVVPFTYGNLQIVAFLSFVVTSVIAAGYGVKLQHYLNPTKVKKVFAIFMIFVAIDMLYSGVHVLIK